MIRFRQITSLLFIFFTLVVGVFTNDAQNSNPNTTVLRTGGGSLTVAGGHLRLKNVDHAAPKMSMEMLKKKYLTFSYDLVTVDDADLKAHLRYNIFEDEMEFVRENSIYYLVKDVGRKVYFEDSKSTYKVLRYNGKLQYFKVLITGNFVLLARHRVRYVEPRPAESGYDKDRPAKYLRLKDEIYLGRDQQVITKLSGIKKSDFLELFGSRSQEIKSFLKKNKLSFKKVDDLEKIIGYYNTLQ